VSGHVRHVVLKIASRCNLNCSYCYLYNHADRSIDSHPKRIPDDVVEQLCTRIANYTRDTGLTVGITLHGGEPTLLGRARFTALVERLRERLGTALGSLSVQTNATLIDAEWASTLAALDLTVGVSLDGTPAVHDRFRITHAGEGSYAATVRGIDRLRDTGIEPRILSVVDPSGDGAATYAHFRALGLRRVDFLLPDVSHDHRARLYGEEEAPVFRFLDGALDAWLEEGDADVHIPLFTELITARLTGRAPRTDCFGNPALSYIVVNADGSIEPLDALKVCEEGITQTSANVARTDFLALSDDPGLLGRTLRGEVPLCRECRDCEHVVTCGGGYLPHRYSRARGFDNPSVWCRDIKLLLARIDAILRLERERPCASVPA